MRESNTASTPETPDDQFVAEIVQGVSERIQRGEAVDLNALLAQHPEHAVRLKRLLPTIEALAAIDENGPAAGESATSAARGSTIGEYQIVREIAQGGMGIVYEARQVALSRRVALKVLPFAAALDPRALARFKQESLAAAQLDHPHIVPVYGVGVERGIHYYAMRYIEGQSLAQVIAEMKGPVSPFSRAPQPSAAANAVEALGSPRELKGRELRSRGQDQCSSGWLQPAGDSNAESVSDASRNDPDATRVFPPFAEEEQLRACCREFAANSPHGANTLGPTSPSTNLQSPIRSPKSGSTLAHLAAGISTDRVDNRKEFYRGVARVGIQAAEALDYAHQHGILHRDVKPGNLLLDEGGEVYITDFGLARIENEANLTRTGDLMGTLRYMSPEQATAARGLVDQRSDVYSLGATLYELLTLRPIFTAEDRARLLRQITEEDPLPPRALERSLPAELETIVLKCLEKDPSRRYATAQALADDLARFLEHQPIRARRAGSGERFAKWCRRHKPVAFAAVLFLVMTGLFGMAVIYDHSERRRTATALVNEALEAAATRHGEARASIDDLSAWKLAIAEANHAADLAYAGPTDLELRHRVARVQSELKSQADAAKVRVDAVDRDRTMLQELKAIHLETSIDWGESGNSDIDEACRRAFRDYDIDLANSSVNDAARRIRTSAIFSDLVATIDCWAIWRPTPGRPEQSARLLEIAKAADPDDSWRNKLRGLCGTGPEQELSLLLQLARSTDAPGQPVEYLTRISRRLAYRGAPAEALRLLQRAQRERPGDFWVNYALGYAHFRTVTNDTRKFDPGEHSGNAGPATLNAIAQQVRYFSVASALNPSHATAHFNLGNALASAGAIEDAIVEFRETIRLDPRVGGAFSNLGIALMMKGDKPGALEAFREGVRYSPEDPFVHNNLAKTLSDQGDLESAIAEHRRALQLDPDYAEAHMGLGTALLTKGDHAGAIAAYRRALELNSNDAIAHCNLGIALSDKDDLDGAIAEYRRALELKGDYPHAHNNLGYALYRKGDFEGAITHYRRALELVPESIVVRDNLTRAERFQALDARFLSLLGGDAEAITPVERADLAQFASQEKHLYALAAEWYRKAFAEEPHLAEDEAVHRYNAACAAALVSASEPAESLSDSERNEWRAQARRWLAADLEFRAKQAESQQGAVQSAQTLRRWLNDRNLASIRDPQRLAELPDAERAACEALWRDVNLLIAKLQEQAPSSEPGSPQP